MTTPADRLDVILRLISDVRQDVADPAIRALLLGAWGAILLLRDRLRAAQTTC